MGNPNLSLMGPLSAVVSKCWMLYLLVTWMPLEVSLGKDTYVPFLWGKPHAFKWEFSCLHHLFSLRQLVSMLGSGGARLCWCHLMPRIAPLPALRHYPPPPKLTAAWRSYLAPGGIHTLLGPPLAEDTVNMLLLHPTLELSAGLGHIRLCPWLATAHQSRHYWYTTFSALDSVC